MNLPKTIQGFYALLGEYYMVDLTEAQVNMYAIDLNGHTVNELWAAWEAWKSEVNNHKMPLPNHLKAIMNPIMDTKSTGNMIASRIIGLMCKKGQDWLFRSEGRAEIGEGYFDLAEVVVLNRGGWFRMCEQFFATRNEDTYRAQLRDEITATLEAARRGQVHKAPSLLESNNKVTALVGKIAGQKVLEPKKPGEDKK